MRLRILFRNGAKEIIELDNLLKEYIDKNETKKFDKGIINFDEVIFIWESEVQTKV